jgi:Trk-type K+ transport system membrane component
LQAWGFKSSLNMDKYQIFMTILNILFGIITFLLLIQFIRFLDKKTGLNKFGFFKDEKVKKYLNIAMVIVDIVFLMTLS